MQIFEFCDGLVKLSYILSFQTEGAEELEQVIARANVLLLAQLLDYDLKVDCLCGEAPKSCLGVVKLIVVVLGPLQHKVDASKAILEGHASLGCGRDLEDADLVGKGCLEVVGASAITVAGVVEGVPHGFD